MDDRHRNSVVSTETAPLADRDGFRVVDRQNEALLLPVGSLRVEMALRLYTVKNEALLLPVGFLLVKMALRGR